MYLMMNELSDEIRTQNNETVMICVLFRTLNYSLHGGERQDFMHDGFGVDKREAHRVDRRLDTFGTAVSHEIEAV